MQRVILWLVLVLLVLPALVAGQNLIPNGGFETYQHCPEQSNLLFEAAPWYNPTKATPDFYHQCFAGSPAQLAPHSGQGQTHLFFDKDFLEYMAVPLTEPLKANECYYFEMYVAPDVVAKYIPGTLGAYFSAQPVTSGMTTMLTASPQVLDNTAQGNVARLQWQSVSGSFTASGGEAYVTIGSFYKEPPFLGYYYIYVDDVSLRKVKLDLGNDTTLCSRQSTHRLDATTPGAFSYRWNDGSTQPTLLVTKPGRYSVTAVTGCKTLVDSVKIDYAIDLELGPDTTLCEGQTLKLNVPADAAATYRWQDGSGGAAYTVSQAGTYRVTVSRAKCVVADSVQVRYVPRPTLELGPDRELCGTQSARIQPVVKAGTFRWLDGFADQERTVSQNGVFQASVQNECATVTDSVAVDYDACDCRLYAPNSFTPNRDGLNDQFLVYGCGAITIRSMRVFNRWGEVIFETQEAPFQWDGYYQGQLAESGPYAWQIDYQLKIRKRITNHQQQGTLTLVR
ncbi:gliding motility-associated C-terminal domain-containing protein [Spirosoma sp. KUDC1026]|uniref:T9SS type B sorting domain-containing protein n=1 Tax=Spirosoma sp. KUDC1026 TaxID=2745947 RepID=UPI00159BE4D6|nr:gliding motility-associated C-terminal domain-containing protein [Spirosoma sp. KUDC1026]QKZ14986.1 gliding motility-associated C-terminal domain-containing protein [Spirosoma sp. KUDC1026]